jgi:hypothetical protein
MIFHVNDPAQGDKPLITFDEKGIAYICTQHGQVHDFMTVTLPNRRESAEYCNRCVFDAIAKIDRLVVMQTMTEEQLAEMQRKKNREVLNVS